MNRRRFITGVAVTATISALSGCSVLQNDDENGNDDGNGNATDGGNETNDGETNSNNSDNGGDSGDEQAAERFQEALDLLVTNQEQLDSLEPDDAERDSDDIDEMRDRLDDADAALDDAAHHTDDELMADVETARNVAEFQSLLVDTHALGIEMNERLELAITFFEGGQDQRAAEEVESITELTQQARSLLDDIETVHEELTTGRLDEPALAYGGEYTDYIRPDNRNEFDIVDTLVTGSAEFFRAFEAMFEGFEAFGADEYDDAESSFETARGMFESSGEKISSVQERDNLPSDLGRNLIAFTSFVDTAGEAASLFKEAAQSAQNGNMQEADSLFREATNLLEEIE